MALAYRPPGVFVEELFSPSVNPLLASPGTVCFIGDTRGFIRRSDRVALTNNDAIPLPNFPRDAATLLDPVVSVTNVELIRAYDPGEYVVNYDDAVDEVQLVTISGATSGAFTLQFKDEVTASINYNASAAAVESALEALSNIDPADVNVTGSAGGPYTVTFSGQYADTNLEELKVDTADLGGSNPDADVHTIAEGGVKGTIARANGSAIPEGATVTVVYRYRPDNFFVPTRIDQQSQIEEYYGPAYDANGKIVNPLALATQIAFENGARDVVVQPLFKLLDSNDPDSKRLNPSDADVQVAGTWEQTFYSLRDIEDINILVPVVGQSLVGMSDAEMLGVFQALANHLEFIESEQQYGLAVIGEDSSTNSSVAQKATLRSHATVLRDSREGAVAENFVFVSPSKFVTVNPATGLETYVGGQYVAAAIAGMLSGSSPSASITRRTLSGFTAVGEVRTKADKNVDASNGLTVLEDRGEAILLRHAITLDNTSSARREIPVVRSKHFMIESIRDTIDTQIIGRVIADGNAPGVVSNAVASVLDRLVTQRTIVDYKNVQARTLATEPTTVEVRYSYRPAYPLNYVDIRFSIDIAGNGGVNFT